MKILFLLIALLACTSFSESQEILWQYDTKDASFGQSASGDIDNDGKLEIVFSCYRNDGNVYAINAEDGSLLWKYNTAIDPDDGCNDVAPLICDVDKDGKLDVVLAASCTPITYCFEGKTGNIKWQCNTRGSDSPPTIGDIDNDGKEEILHGEFWNYLICIDAATGTVKWEMEIQPDCWIQTAPTLVDIDGDGGLDFVIATWAFDDTDNNIYAFRGKDRSLIWKKPLNGTVYHGTAVADVDRDGKIELFLGSYNDTLYCLNAIDGSTKWKYAASQSFYAGANPTVADLDNNGLYEVVMPFWYKMTVLKHNGEVLWEYDIPDAASAFRGAAIADVNNDEFMDITFGTSSGKLIALSGNSGNLIFSKDLSSHYGNELYGLDHAPLVSDFNKDGNIDVFIVGGYGITEHEDNFGRAYMLTIGKGKGPDWLMFQKNIRRTSSFWDNTLAVHESRTKPEDYIYISPNPATDFIEISQPSEGCQPSEGSAYGVRIYNVFGQEVYPTPALPAGEGVGSSSQYSLLNTQYSLRIDVSALPAGLYFVRVCDKVAKFLKY